MKFRIYGRGKDQIYSHPFTRRLQSARGALAVLHSQVFFCFYINLSLVPRSFIPSDLSVYYPIIHFHQHFLFPYHLLFRVDCVYVTCSSK